MSTADWMWRTLTRTSWALACWLLLGCSSGSGGNTPTGGPKSLGERCTQTEECASLICVRLDEAGGVCSTTCQDGQGCPASDNWGCLPVPDQAYSVCACLPLSSSEICGDGLDNDCDGQIDNCRTCGGKPVPSSDHDNCGECGRTCRDDQACQAEKCECSATAPDDCGGRCTSTKTDPLNCGACGDACGAGQACQNGRCACTSFATPDFCDGIGCVDFESDDEHCGACDNACGSGQACDHGECRCPAGAAQDFCEGLGCVDLDRDPNNCGDCGASCVADQLCSGGECVCPNGKVLCGDACVDVRTDKVNCGDCGNACPDTQVCSGGECGCSAADLSVCGEGCANLRTDLDNCGACGNTCADGESCDGACACASGVYCGSSCMAVGDAQNCGACGNACPASRYCNGGRCQCQGFGLTQCASDCVDTNTDEQHCGDCNTTCRTGEVCTYGDCQCPSGQQYCPSAGKCVATLTDTANCGACGQACNPSEVCSGGSCTCPTAGQLYCAAEGKCVDTRSNVAHCGDCATACNPTEVCSNGSCDCTGYSEQYCASAKACVDVWTSSQHCGACDKACPAKTHCAGGGCTCDAAGQTLCGSSCFNLQTDPKNCGACGHDCGGAFSCSGGKCQCPTPTVGTAVRLTNTTLAEARPAAAWDGTHVGVAYLQQIATGGSAFNLRFALLNPDGTLFKDVALTSYLESDLRSAGSADDTLGIVWNGSEYGIVWDDNAAQDTVRLIRVTPAGVASASVAVATEAELPGPVGPSIGWSAPYGGYLITGAIWNRVYYRRVGAQGTSLETLNGFDSPYTCKTSLAVAANGAASVACNYAFYGNVGFFNPDGSRTQGPGGLGVTSAGTDAESIWDGTTFDTTVISDGGSVRMFRRGSSAAWLELLPYTSGTTRSSIDTVWLGNSLALGSVTSGTYDLRRYLLSADLAAEPTTFHDPITVVSTANVAGKPDLVTAGPGKLLLVWPDNRWGTSELYAAPIDLKACP